MAAEGDLLSIEDARSEFFLDLGFILSQLIPIYLNGILEQFLQRMFGSLRFFHIIPDRIHPASSYGFLTFFAEPLIRKSLGTVWILCRFEDADR